MIRLCPARRKTKLVHHRASRVGLTLLEVTVSTLLVAIVLVMSLSAGANIRRNQLQIVDRKNSVLLATLLLDEISSRAFSDSQSPGEWGLEADESHSNRQTLDDIDDYDGYTQSPPRHRDGSLVNEYEDWRWSVTVAAADYAEDGLRITADVASPLRLVQVTCRSPNGVETVESTYLSNVGSNRDRTQSQHRNLAVEVTLSSGRSLTVFSPLHNFPSAPAD